MDRAFSYILFANAVILFIFAILQLLIKHKARTNYLLSLLYFIFGYFLLYDWLGSIEALHKFTPLMYSDISVSFFMGPLLYSYTKSITGSPAQYTLPYFLRYIPAITAMFFFFLNNPGGDVFIEGNNSLYPGGHFKFNFVFIMSVVSDIWLFLFVVSAANKLYKFIKENKESPVTVLWRLFFVYLIVILSFPLFFLSYFFKTDILIGLGLLMNGLNGIYFFFLSFRYPEYTQQTIVFQKKSKNIKGNLGNIDVYGVVERLHRLMNDDKVYRLPDITIQSLSNLLDIKTYHLSEILNEQMNLNFRTFINSYRLKEAMTLLLEQPDSPILDIAFSVGFNSKSSFHTIFVKETGINPTDYRRQNKKKVQNY